MENLKAGMSQHNKKDDAPEPHQDSILPTGQGKEPGIRRIKLSDLMAGRREVIIEHDGNDYRLRVTSRSRLILTK